MIFKNVLYSTRKTAMSTISLKEFDPRATNPIETTVGVAIELAMGPTCLYGADFCG